MIRRRDFSPVGVHNLENALASIGAAIPFDVPLDAMRKALRAYRPLPHRMELVRVVDGVAYINDSKATNVDATAKSLESIDGPVIVILGGRDKEGDFGALLPYLKSARRAVLIGEARNVIARALAGRVDTTEASDMADAVRSARASAKPGDTVFQEEVFGPFVTVTRFADEAEAVALANATEYGLGSGLWTRDLSRAHRFARELKAGMVWINSYKRVNPGSPFGGVGQSGYGREMGFDAMREYTQVKSVWVNVDAQIPPWYPR